jgi:hypothetical protein
MRPGVKGPPCLLSEGNYLRATRRRVILRAAPQ